MPRRFATRAICETLKTRVKLNLNFTRPHAITYTNCPVKQPPKMCCKKAANVFAGIQVMKIFERGVPQWAPAPSTLTQNIQQTAKQINNFNPPPPFFNNFGLNYIA